ncbi:putative O-methyltransferase YrrM [Labrys monachus]|uniref:O-methyltransferase YrrM n=1 Tax=Labrys monachus TaxID=217067 RepID=A0ABU0F9J2_9HYPH|nr:putative O-methyltransferase YrrM [Labrys monachus]
MTILNSKPVADVLSGLLGLPNASSQSTRPLRRRSQSQYDAADPVRSKKRYLEFYRQMKDMPLAVSRETGLLLYMLARSSRAETIVEFGTSFGVSTIYLASALRDSGGGRLISTEFEPSKIARAPKPEGGFPHRSH